MAAEESNYLLIFSKLDSKKTGKVIYETVKKLADENYKPIFTTYFTEGQHHSKITKVPEYDYIYKISYNEGEIESITKEEAATLIKLSKDENLFKYSTINDQNLRMFFEKDMDPATFYKKIQDLNKFPSESEKVTSESNVESNEDEQQDGNVGETLNFEGSTEITSSNDEYVESILDKELYDKVVGSIAKNGRFFKSKDAHNTKDMRWMFFGLIVKNIKDDINLNNNGNFISPLAFRMNDNDNKIILPLSKEIADCICNKSETNPFQFKYNNQVNSSKMTIFNITFKKSNKNNYDNCKFRFKKLDSMRNDSQMTKNGNNFNRPSTSLSSSAREFKGCFKVSRSFTALKELFDEQKIDKAYYSDALNKLYDDNKISNQVFADEVRKMQQTVY